MYLIDKIPIKEIAEQIKEICPENCIISSDMGQAGNPDPELGTLSQPRHDG